MSAKLAFKELSDTSSKGVASALSGSDVSTSAGNSRLPMGRLNSPSKLSDGGGVGACCGDAGGDETLIARVGRRHVGEPRRGSEGGHGIGGDGVAGARASAWPRNSDWSADTSRDASRAVRRSEAKETDSKPME